MDHITTEKQNGCQPRAAAFFFASKEGETDTTEFAPPRPSQQLIYDPRRRSEKVQDKDFPVLLEIAEAVILSDSNLDITLTCVTNPGNITRTSRSLNGRVSVKRVRILDYIESHYYY